MKKFLLYLLLTFSCLFYFLSSLTAARVFYALFIGSPGKIEVDWMEKVGAPISLLVCLFFFFLIGGLIYKGYVSLSSHLKKAALFFVVSMVLSVIFYGVVFDGYGALLGAF